ncbi:MAG: TolC family protein [Thermoanaerobaculia bacterium]
MKRILRTAVVFLVAAMPAMAQTPDAPPLTLTEAVRIALDGNPAMRAAGAGQSMAQARLSQARDTWLPQVQLSGRYTDGDNPVYVFGSLLEQGRFGAEHFDPAFLNSPEKLENYRASLDVRLAIFDQLRRYAANKQARVGVDQAEAQVELARQQMRYGVTQAYYGVLLAEAAKEVADEAARTAEAEVKRIRDSFETGLIVQSDYLAAEVQLADIRQQQIAATGNVAVAHAAFNSALGINEPRRHTLAGTLTQASLPVPDESEAIATALAERPEIRIARLTERASELGARAAAGQFLPRLDGFASFGASGTELTTDGSDSIIGAVVTLNIHDPGRIGRLAEARAAQRYANAERERLESQVRLEAVQARERLVAANDRVAVAQRAVDQAQEAYRIVGDRYHSGLTTITELLRADTARLAARMRLIAAQADYATGYANLLLATGKLEDISTLDSRSN